MSYVRWSSKVVQGCKVRGNEGWVALLPPPAPAPVGKVKASWREQKLMSAVRFAA